MYTQEQGWISKVRAVDWVGYTIPIFSKAFVQPAIVSFQELNPSKRPENNSVSCYTTNTKKAIEKITGPFN